MAKEILDLDPLDENDNEYSFEVQKSSGGAGSSKRRKTPFRGSFDLSVEEYPNPDTNDAIGSGANNSILSGDTWYGINSGDFDVEGFDDPITLFRGALLIYIGGDVALSSSWIVKQ